MKRRSRPSGKRPMAAFASTVVLAVLASLALLMPDYVAPSVDSLADIPNRWDQILPADMFD